MAYTLENGLFFLVDDKGVVVPAMNDKTDNSIDFDTNVSPFLSKELSGDFEIYAEFCPFNMSLSDSYGIYAYTDDDRFCYIKMHSDLQGNSINSGCVDIMDFENPSILSVDENVYLKITRKGNHFNLSYSNDGENYISHGKCVLESDSPVRVGFQLSSFQGSAFYIRVRNITIN